MRRKLILILACACFFTADAQDPLTQRARAWLDTLCSPDFHGRGYVKDGDRIASEWIASKFRQFGVKPVKADFYQPFQFNVNSFPDSMRVAIDGRKLNAGTEFLLDAESGTLSGSFTLVHVTPSDLQGPERKGMTMGVLLGKAACLHWPETGNGDSLRMFRQWERELMDHCVVVKPAKKLTWSVATDARRFPLIEVAEAILSDSSSSIDLSIRNALVVRRPARNVLGMVKGKSKKWVVIGAHYDHLGRMGADALFPGANDNASGTAMLLSLAEHFTKRGNAPKHNLLFVAFAGEEAGLIGSEWCAVDRPIDWKHVSMMINLDILGTGDDGIMVVNATAQQKAFDQLVAINGSKGYLKEVKARGPACNSDHCHFVKRGVPAIYIYTLGGVAHYHDVMDRAETLPLTEFADLHALLRDFIQGLK
ncbi:MAG TPA: M28 family peptidase [Flavobacteriales bacterium]|nr:M28 family peptidase [Flavobacteriales bacterium]